MMTPRDIIGLWPNPTQLARDLGMKSLSSGPLFWQRNSIPVEHWPAVLEAAKRRRIKGLSLKTLMDAHAAAAAEKKASRATAPG